MRLYLKDGTGDEFTQIKFHTVNNAIALGGVLSFTYRDPLMANIAIVKKFTNQRVEVRKNDGSTVIWEGVINFSLFNSITQTWLISGSTTGRILAETACYYNGLLASGIVTLIDTDDTPPEVTDSNQTFNNSLQDSFAVFSDKGAEEDDQEVIWPNSDSSFVNGGIAPTSTDGDWTDLKEHSTSMLILDTNDRALDYYGIEIVWTVPNEDTSVKATITIDCMFQNRSYFATDGSDSPIIQIYDFVGGTWRKTDASTSGDVSGLGRITGGATAWGGSHNARYIRYIEITSNLSKYFDGSNKCKVRVLMGQTGEGIDTVRVYQAILINKYGVLFSADNVAYQIDDVTSSVLTFTGQTPYANGIRIGDTFKIGDLLHNVASKMFRFGMINWITLSMDTSSLIDPSNLKGSYILPILKRYADQENWRIWDKIGWIFRVGAPSVSTSLSLTEANFTKWTFDADGQKTTRSAITGTSGKVEQTRHSSPSWIYSFLDDVIVDDLFATQANAASAGVNYLARKEIIAHHFVGTIDLDDGTDYSAIELGKLITITLYTDKHVFTSKEIDKISYTQDSGGHLFCEIMVIE
ncbi:MAG: hypothetical protein HeimC3_40870 [Candidatus Heimdallarchaeota archaeon LC_3]|nr:MAG: hypothetical protein HeimC3_40870 [Candidatus Heimdallarchaeota archaeon LC_3]